MFLLIFAYISFSQCHSANYPARKTNKKRIGGTLLKRNVKIITDIDGTQIVLIDDIRFRGKSREEWNEIENYLKEYVGSCYEIAETAEKVYIGKEFPDEFVHAQAIDKLIQIATNKSMTCDYGEKRGTKAQNGWYRYDTRLALPVYSNSGEVERYNIFKLRMLIRHDADGKMYLYDFLRTKKEMSSPPK